MIIDQILPHGYAFAQVSVMGTGRSNHCMDLMGNAEQLGVDAAVTWLGSQDWSNGAVSMIGKSYDGSTPWQAATFGNEYLKTIVPISGLIGVMELMWKNGSSEARAPIMHNGVLGHMVLMVTKKILETYVLTISLAQVLEWLHTCGVENSQVHIGKKDTS